MEYQGERYISPNYRKEDYKELNLSVDSDAEIWDRAIEIFDDRIKCRFFHQIDQLLAENIKDNGFAIMALDCLLVDTLLQFRDGLVDGGRKGGDNSVIYPAFLAEEFSDIFRNKKSAEEFYRKIRCGILHSAQTKKNAVLSASDSFVVKFENNFLTVSVKGFSLRLRKYYAEYVKRLSVAEETKLRNNFIVKMNDICTR